jgi:hypothetical protein
MLTGPPLNPGADHVAAVIPGTPQAGARGGATRGESCAWPGSGCRDPGTDEEKQETCHAASSACDVPHTRWRSPAPLSAQREGCSRGLNLQAVLLLLGILGSQEQARLKVR